MKRETLAAACLEAIDGSFLRALAEPARVAILRTLIIKGRADVGTIAREAPHDRSVTTRHLRVLEAARLVRSAREGRHTVYRLDGEGTIAHLEGLLALFRSLAPLCCPPTATPVEGSTGKRRAASSRATEARRRGRRPTHRRRHLPGR
jgi:DNA-binding transcriptional ArsR family regulator